MPSPSIFAGLLLRLRSFACRMWRGAKKTRIARAGLDTDEEEKKAAHPSPGKHGLLYVVLFSKANRTVTETTFFSRTLVVKTPDGLVRGGLAEASALRAHVAAGWPCRFAPLSPEKGGWQLSHRQPRPWSDSPDHITCIRCGAPRGHGHVWPEAVAPQLGDHDGAWRREQGAGLPWGCGFRAPAGPAVSSFACVCPGHRAAAALTLTESWCCPPVVILLLFG